MQNAISDTKSTTTVTTVATILILLIPITSSSIHHPDGFIYKECLPEKEVCEYWLNIQEKLTMVFHKDLVYADKGRLYLYNEHPSNYTTEVIIWDIMYIFQRIYLIGFADNVSKRTTI